MDKQHKPGEQQQDTGAGPDEIMKWRAVPDENDAEGHGVKYKAIPEGDQPGPDGADGDEPGPDGGVRGRY